MSGNPTIEINGWKYEKYQKYYLYSKEGPLNTMKISYRVQGGYGWCKCGIQVGYIDGTTKDRYICEYNSDDDIWEAKTEIQMSDVLIVLVAIQKKHDYLYYWMFHEKFTQRFQKELSLYKRSLTDPDSLKNLCRQVVRQRMKRLSEIDILQLPPSIERYICCTRGRCYNGGCEYCKK